MGTGLPVGKRKDLYHFWEDRLKKYFQKHWNEKELVVNLASNEYFKAFKNTGLRNPVLNVDFKDFSKRKF
ncbi:MAG: peroxide stress protein YaaA [Owenweeksia sp.]|nr:peroxide stress protein YaaA [Owenweeksia sp.]